MIDSIWFEPSLYTSNGCSNQVPLFDEICEIDDEGKVLFLRKSIKCIFRVCWSLPGWPMKYLLLLGLFLQSCAITTTETKIVPGQELSKTSLGLREIENKNVMKEITPYSVGIFRKVCDAELFRIEYKGLSESVHKRQELYCATAYIEYIAIQITTLGFPFLYDLATGFGDFRGMCDKGPLKISNNTLETNATVSQEILESNNAICRDVPISNAEVTAEIDSNISKLVSSASGIAALTPELMTSVGNLKRDVFVSYRYMDETKKTTIEQVAKSVIQVVKAENQNSTKMSIEASAPDIDSPDSPLKDKLSENSLEDEAYKLTLAAIGKYKGELSSISAGSEKKQVLASFRVGLDFNESDVNEESLGDLKKFVEIMKNNPNLVGIIEGHTDDLGSTRLSHKMSLQRATALKDMFVNRYGIATKRFMVYGYGSTKPLVDIDSAEGSAKNRRIEIRTSETAVGL